MKRRCPSSGPLEPPRSMKPKVRAARTVCGGVRIDPGDLIVGDRDGVVSVPRDRVAAVLRQAGLREEREAVIREGLRAGASTVELLGLAASLERAGLAT